MHPSHPSQAVHLLGRLLLATQLHGQVGQATLGGWGCLHHLAADPHQDWEMAVAGQVYFFLQQSQE